jgi:hypothetical protein
LAEKRLSLAEKEGSVGKYFTLFFAVFLFFGIMRVASRCVSRTSRGQTPAKKIVPKTYRRFSVFPVYDIIGP